MRCSVRLYGHQRRLHSACSSDHPADTQESHAWIIMHKTSQQSVKKAGLLTMIMHFFSLLSLRFPEPSIQRFPCQRQRYVTAATDPAVHITNAVHCGGDHVLEPGSIQAPAAIAVAQLLQRPVLSVCWESLSHVPLTLLSSHVQRSLTLLSTFMFLLWALTEQRSTHSEHQRNIWHNDWLSVRPPELGGKERSSNISEVEAKRFLFQIKDST